MLIVMKAEATAADVDRVVQKIASLGFVAHPIPGSSRTAIGITGNKGEVLTEQFEALPGVAQAIRVSKPYKLVSTEVKAERTIVDVGGVKVGGGHFAVMAGPCAVENEA